MSIFGSERCEGSPNSALQDQLHILSSKAIVTVWAEESGKINDRQAEWSFGGGGSGLAHSKGGYIMLADGYILRMGLTSVGASGRGIGEVVLSILIDGEVQAGEYFIRKPENINRVVKIFNTPLKVRSGSAINFMSRSNAEAKSSHVSLLIELNL